MTNQNTPSNDYTCYLCDRETSNLCLDCGEEKGEAVAVCLRCWRNHENNKHFVPKSVDVDESVD